MTLVIAVMLIAGLDLSFWWYPLVLIMWMAHIGFWKNEMDRSVTAAVAVAKILSETEKEEEKEQQ